MNSLSPDVRSMLDSDVRRRGRAAMVVHLTEQVDRYAPTHEHPAHALLRANRRRHYVDALAYVVGPPPSTAEPPNEKTLATNEGSFKTGQQIQRGQVGVNRRAGQARGGVH